MRVTRFFARNVLTFGDPGFEWDDIPDLSVIVGPNGSGKTNILRILGLVGEAFYLRHPSGPQRLLSVFPEGDSLVEVTVQLDAAEQKAAIDLLAAAAKLQMVNWQDPKVDQSESERIARELISRCPGMFYSLIDSGVTLGIRTRANPARPIDLYLILGGRDRSLFANPSGLSNSLDAPRGWNRVEVKRELFAEFRRFFPKVAVSGVQPMPATERQLRRAARAISRRWLIEKLSPTKGQATVFDFSGLEFTQYEAQMAPRPSDLTSFRSFVNGRGWQSQSIGILDLFGLIYRASLVRLSDMRARPRDLPLSSPLSEIQRVESGPIDGTDLAPSLFDLKNAADSAARLAFRDLQDSFRQFSGIDFDVVQLLETDEEGKERRNAALRILGKGYEVPADFAAAGLLELLTFLYTTSFAEDSVLLLDEPALNLHPTLQTRLFKMMASKAKKHRNQVVVVTHSPYFVGINDLQSIHRVTLNKAGQTTLYRYTAGSPLEVAQATKNLQRYPELLASLFSKGVVLVEGDQEAAGFPIWFAKCEAAGNLDVQNVYMINVHGKDAFQNYSRILDRLAVPFRVVGDGDAKAQTAVFGKLGYSYPQPDYSDILTQYYPKQLAAAIKSVGASKGKKDPAVAREVALATKAPKPVRDVWRFLRSFVTT